jgi:hypothetical protein
VTVAPTDFSFAPDTARGARLDAAVRQGLAESLATLFDTLAPSFAVDPRRAAALARRIGAGRVPASLFGAYVDLVLATFDERADAIQALLDEILSDPPPKAGGLHIATLDDGDLGAGLSERYRRLLSDDVDAPFEPLPISARAPARARLTAALRLLEAGAPDAYGEFSALVGQIVLVTAREGPDQIAFGGASTFSLWGAIALNADPLDDRLTGAVMLAHETAHCLLFGLAQGGRLVENNDDERHPSPLRRDGRPMEGVAHATFVAARMAHALRAMLASGALDPAEAGRARAMIDRNRAAYEAGLRTVLAGARFTPAGAAAYEGLRRDMDGPGQADER